MPATTLAPPPTAGAEFDAYSARYEAALAEGLQVSGEGPDYFAKKRIDWTARIVERMALPAANILDYGCGVGLAAPHLIEAFLPAELWGYDPAAAAIARASAEASREHIHFTSDPEALPRNSFDGAYVNGVFHHIVPSERPSAFEIVYQALRPGGWFAFWENNPWNPGTRVIMRRVPFDRDAVTITPPEARKLLRQAGFAVVRTDAWFLFPRALSWLRPLERLVHKLPLGGQYLVLACKPKNQGRAEP